MKQIVYTVYHFKPIDVLSFDQRFMLSMLFAFKNIYNVVAIRVCYRPQGQDGRLTARLEKKLSHLLVQTRFKM